MDLNRIWIKIQKQNWVKFDLDPNITPDLNRFEVYDDDKIQVKDLKIMACYTNPLPDDIASEHEAYHQLY
jgi:hypothetical protein